MPREPMTQSGRLSKKSPGEAEGAQGGPSEGGGGALGRGRGALGLKAGAKAIMGTDGKETRCSLQEGLQMDLSLRNGYGERRSDRLGTTAV